MPELWDLDDLALVAIRVVNLLSWLLLVIVSGLAVAVRDSHIHKASVFTGSASIRGHTTGPTLAIAGGRTIAVLQGFVFEVWI